jgi:hypothetical protein
MGDVHATEELCRERYASILASKVTMETRVRSLENDRLRFSLFIAGMVFVAAALGTSLANEWMRSSWKSEAERQTKTFNESKSAQ